MHHSIPAIKRLSIFTVPNPSFKQRLAATELSRGLLQLGYEGHTVVGELPEPKARPGELRFVLSAGAEEDEGYKIAGGEDGGPTIVTISGAGEQGLLYGVFGFLERQGAFFGLDGDLYPLDKPPAL